MKLQERTGKWVEIERSKGRDGEITLQVPNSIWPGMQNPIFLDESDLAVSLRMLGWDVVLPAEKHRV